MTKTARDGVDKEGRDGKTALDRTANLRHDQCGAIRGPYF